MLFDSVCLNEQCIRKRNAFFEFDPESDHLSKNHTVKSIHPITFATYFPKDLTSNQSVNGQQICATLEKFREDAFQCVVESVRSLFQDSKLFHGIEKQLPLCEGINMKNLIARLTNGDYALLQIIKQFDTQKKQNNFKSYLCNSVRAIDQQLKRHFTSLKKMFLDVCNNLSQPISYKSQKSFSQPLENKTSNSNNPQQIMSNPTLNISEKHQVNNQQEYAIKPQLPVLSSQIPLNKPTIYEPMREVSVKLEQVQPHSYFFGSDHRKLEQMDYKCEEDESDDDQQNDNPSRNEAPVQKIKSISKKPSESKTLKKRRKNYVLTDGIQILSQQQVIINESRNPLKTLKFLQQKFPLLSTLHIFHDAMAKQPIIKQILRAFPKIKRITLNCYFQFEPKVFSQASIDILSGLSVELKWDVSKFFTEYHAYKHFPYRSIKRLQRVKPINVQQLHSIIPNNTSLWDCDYTSRQWLNKKILRYSQITSARFNVSLDNPFPLLYHNLFRNIKVLVLSELWSFQISQVSKLLQMLSGNLHLQTIVFDKSSISNENLNQILIQIQKLPRLLKLSISVVTSIPLVLDPKALFSIINLTHLNIQNIKFSKNQNEQQCANLRDISKLVNIKHLSLYNCGIVQQRQEDQDQLLYNFFIPCEPISSSFLRYLSPSAIASLQFLNLGSSNIDNSACYYLKKMVSLLYLNIDETKIEGSALLDAFKQISRLNFLGNRLKELSIQARFGSKQLFTRQHLEQMSNYLPKLAYINIAFLDSIVDYDFSGYKSLKTIALSQYQLQLLDLKISPEINRFKITRKK